MGITGTIYNVLFKRSSTFALTMIVGAYALEAVIDSASIRIFESINQGKLWHHIKNNYTKKELD